MVLLWITKVLRAKGMSEDVINILLNLYNNNILLLLITYLAGVSQTSVGPYFKVIDRVVFPSAREWILF